MDEDIRSALLRAGIVINGHKDSSRNYSLSILPSVFVDNEVYCKMLFGNQIRAHSVQAAHT